MQDVEQTIRERAYHLWVAEGQRGDEVGHWLAAQREVLASSLGTLGSISAPPKAKKPKKPAARKTKAA